VLPDVTGLILAGGRGSRMQGADKGLLHLDGKTLLEHVLQRVRPQCADVMISANRNLPAYKSLGVDVVEDLRAQLPGPLAGIEAGLSRISRDWLFVAPCDLPYLPHDAAARLLEAALAHKTTAAFARTDTASHTAVCLLHRSLRPALKASLDAGQYRMRRWFDHVAALPVRFDEAGAFANMNSPGDLVSGTRQ
jgi:molybdenum cofactor guanylyltransferase